MVMQKFVQKTAVGRYTCTLGDKLQQHVAATDHSMCTGRATSCSNKVRRHVAATNRFVCTGEFLWKSLSPKQNFVAATSRKKSSQTEFVRLVAATSVAYTRNDSRSLQSVASRCCCNLSPSVYRPYEYVTTVSLKNSRYWYGMDFYTPCWPWAASNRNRGIFMGWKADNNQQELVLRKMRESS